MKNHTAVYWVIGAAALIFSVSLLFSQYIKYQQLQLSRDKAVQECIDKKVGDATGIRAFAAARKCRDAYLNR